MYLNQANVIPFQCISLHFSYCKGICLLYTTTKSTIIAQPKFASSQWIPVHKLMTIWKQPEIGIRLIFMAIPTLENLGKFPFYEM